MADPQHKTDHVEEARRLAGWLGDPANPSHREDARDPLIAAAAQAHASIAIAEQLRGMREALAGVIETNHIPNGTVDRRLRVTDA